MRDSVYHSADSHSCTTVIHNATIRTVPGLSFCGVSIRRIDFDSNNDLLTQTHACLKSAHSVCRVGVMRGYDRVLSG